MKNKVIKIIAGVIAVLIVGVIGLLAYVKLALPNVGDPPDLKVELTPERIARGEYLANHVTVCMDCHSQRDWSKFAGPIIPGTLGSGGEIFPAEAGFPGNFYAKNLTPYHLKNWTDGEIYRAVTSGVNKDGKALFPVMPYHKYGRLANEDIYSIIAYLRTLKPIKKDIPESDPDFPMDFIINTIPTPGKHDLKPDKSNSVRYGEYLVTAAACADCHTPQKKGTPIEGMEFAGGFEFKLPTGGIVRTANITPDKTTGIGNWSKQMFLDRFKAYAPGNYKGDAVDKNDFNSMMPWTMYAGMKTEDLEAIYDYLMTLQPINHPVQRFTP